MNDPVLSCHGLAIRYGARVLVESLDWEVRAGQRWLLAGPNGAGKSSLLLVLAGARRPDAGAVHLAGAAISSWSALQLAGLRALVTDRWIDPFAIPVRSVVAAARFRAPFRTDGEGPGARSAESGLAELDCAHLATRDIRRLSRGERQRVALAAALAQDARLLLLDEPLSHQDPRHQMLVLDCLPRKDDFTCIAAMHNISAAAGFATHALLLAGDGTWHAGPCEEMLTTVMLEKIFGTRIRQIEIGPHRVFVSANGAPV